MAIPPHQTPTHLEDVLVVHGREFRQRPLHLHIPQRHLALPKTSAVISRLLHIVSGDQFDAPIFSDDALHVRPTGC